MKYISTRGNAPVLSFEEAMLSGLARDGGLYVPQTIPQMSSADIAALARTIQRLGEIHREVEFQWIRMFWLQGTRHAESHRGYWKPRIDELTQAWDAMELRYRWALTALRRGSENGEIELRAYDVVAYLLGELVELRAEHAKRCESPAYAQVPEDCQPVDAPSFDEKAPLPYNLKPVIATLEVWRARAARVQVKRGLR